MPSSPERPQIRPDVPATNPSATGEVADLPDHNPSLSRNVSSSDTYHGKSKHVSGLEPSLSSELPASVSADESNEKREMVPNRRVSNEQHKSRGTMGTTIIDCDQMIRLHHEFLIRWQGQDHGLTRGEFQAAVKNVLSVTLTDAEVDRIFKQMDTRDSGLMRWSDYISCISRTAQLRAYMADGEVKPLLQDKMTFIKTKHRDEVVRIRFMPRLSLQSHKINFKSGRYLMLGRQGHLSIWSLNLSFISVHYIGATEGLNPLFFVDIVVLYPSTLIAVTSTDRKIVLYELGSRGIHEKYSIVTLGNCVTCLDFWSDLSSRTTSLLVWGDTAGDIHALEFNVNRLGGIFEKDQNQEIVTRVVYADLVKHKFPAVRMYRAAGVHDDWVTSVKYIPENKAFLSSSRSSNRQSMLYSDWNGKVESRYFLSSKAVLCFDYNHVINILVTGSLDCKVRVWNFFMGQRPVSTLTAHTSPVTHISLNPSTLHVISVDKSRAVKIFDYVEGTVIQSFSGPSLEPMGKRTEITGFFFNSVRCQLILATTVVATATKRTNPSYMAEISAHDFPVSAVCYSSAFGEILTACSNAQISVWSVYTGKHVLQFTHFSSRSQFQDLPWAKDNIRLEVTAMALDSTERCALTGSNDGTVNLWNFSTGVLLTHYTLPETTLVTGVVMDRNSIFATGWFKHVYLLDREEKSLKSPPKCFARYHEEEINCMTLVKGGLLATGSYDGDVVIVSRDTGHPVFVLNAGVSEFPRTMRGKKEESENNEQHNLILEGNDDDSSNVSEFSEEEMITTEDQGILRCIRISDDLVMVSNAITGEAVRVMHRPRLAKVPSTESAFPVYDALKGSHVTHEESAANFKAFESSVEALLFLHTRKHLDPNTATLLTAGAEGWVRAWSLNPSGGLKGQFLATEYLGEAVKAFTTDQANEFLITGDTLGYIKVWDILPYCNVAAKRMSPEERQERRDKFTGMFIFLRSPFLRDKAAEGFKQCHEFHKRRPPDVSNPGATLKTPCLLNVFRAHTQAITCLEYVNEHKLIVTGGKDCSVRIWTLRGSFVGQCGDPWVKLPDPYVVKQPLRILPRDLRRNGSARTLRIIKSGCVPLWDHAMQCVRNYLDEQRKEQQKKAEMEARKVEARNRGENDDEEAESIITQPISLGRKESDLPEELRLANVVHFNWQDPKKSRILGKSFKPNLHHRPVNPVTIEDEFGMYPAYRKIKVMDITHIAHIPTPQLINDIDMHRREDEEENQGTRHATRKKSKVIKGIIKCSAPQAPWQRKDTRSATLSLEAGQNPSASITDSSLQFCPTNNNSCINKCVCAAAADTTNTNANRNALGEMHRLDKLDGTTTASEHCLSNATDRTIPAIEGCPTGQPRRKTKGKNSFFVTQSKVRSFEKLSTTSSARKASRLKRSKPAGKHNKGGELTRSALKLNFNDVMYDVTEETDDEVSTYFTDDDTRDEEDDCSRQDTGCRFPPLAVTPMQLTGHNTNTLGAAFGPNKGSQGEPQSKSPTLPVLQGSRKTSSDLLRSTGLSFGR